MNNGLADRSVRKLFGEGEKKKGANLRRVFCQEGVESAIVGWNSLYDSIKAAMKGAALY